MGFTKVWKVVRQTKNGEFVSIYAPEAIRIEYVVGKFIKCNEVLLKAKYGLSVFQSIDNAKTFIKDYTLFSGTAWLLFEAQATNVWYPAENTRLTTWKARKLFEYLNDKSISPIFNLDWPYGTLHTSALKLTKLVTSFHVEKESNYDARQL